jgi:hypothetical protein
MPAMFNPLTALEIATLVAEGRLAASPEPAIIDLGNQTFGVDTATMDRVLALLRPVATLRGVDLAALEALRGQRAGLKARHASEAPLTEAFYKAAGFARYEAIDINSRFGSMIMDLNLDLDRHYGFRRTCALVVNTGTSEHVFNQAAFLRNAHNLAAPGGLMLHVVPFTGYMNHGFYNYQPGFFYDLAAANGYALERLRLADRDGVIADLRAPSDLAAHFAPFLGLAARNDRSNTFLVALLRRLDASEFVIPCQGRYLSALEGSARDAYEGRQNGSGQRLLFSPEFPPGREPWRRRLRLRVKRSLLKSLRRASRTVLMRL